MFLFSMLISILFYRNIVLERNRLICSRVQNGSEKFFKIEQSRFFAKNPFLEGTVSTSLCSHAIWRFFQYFLKP